MFVVFFHQIIHVWGLELLLSPHLSKASIQLKRGPPQCKAQMRHLTISPSNPRIESWHHANFFWPINFPARCFELFKSERHSNPKLKSFLSNQHKLDESASKRFFRLFLSLHSTNIQLELSAVGGPIGLFYFFLGGFNSDQKILRWNFRKTLP